MSWLCGEDSRAHGLQPEDRGCPMLWDEGRTDILQIQQPIPAEDT